MAHTLTQTKTGQETGTGAAITIHLGFKPKKVELYNETQQSTAYATDKMAADKAMLLAHAADATFIASGGITITNEGFVIGTNASINTASDVIDWFAVQ